MECGKKHSFHNEESKEDYIQENKNLDQIIEANENEEQENSYNIMLRKDKK